MAGVAVKGLRDLNRALAKADKQTRLGVRKELRDTAEPVRREAEHLADARIRNIGPRWGRMRVGVTRSSVYIAPRTRAVGRGQRRRPNLAGLLMERAMEAALERNRSHVEWSLEQMLDRVADRFNRGGVV